MKAWKALEDRVASRLGGKRQVRSSYGEASPDVVVNIGEALGLASPINLYIECKYRRNQPWFLRVTENRPIIRVKSLYIMNIDRLYWLIEELRSGKIVEIPEVESTIPRYVKDWLKQAESYINDPKDIAALATTFRYSRVIWLAIPAKYIDKLCP